MTTTTAPKLGSKMRLPDGPYGEVVRVEEGFEYSEPVYYVTVRNSLGEQTRWVRR